MISGVSSKNDGKQDQRKNRKKKKTKQKKKAVQSNRKQRRRKPNPVDLHVQSIPWPLHHSDTLDLKI